LIATDDRMSAFSWSLTVPNLVAVCALIITMVTAFATRQLDVSP
jgi:hypothetical protein